MSERKSIVVVDDHTLFRKGICALINSFPEYSIQFEAANGEEFLAQFTPYAVPDIVLLDVLMPKMDGYNTAAWIKKNYPKIKILALSTMESELTIVKMIRNGANGYILKDAEPEELKLAFKQVFSQGYYYNDSISSKIVQSFNNIVDEKQKSGLEKLTNREMQFLKLACTEKSYFEISKELNVSERTVDGYRDSLFKKLNVSSRIGLVIYAFKNEVVKI